MPSLIQGLMDTLLFWGSKASDRSKMEAVSVEDGNMFVSDRGIPASLTVKHIVDLTTTRQKLSFPSGAVWVALQYRLEPGETATANQWAKFCVNAVSDADADGKLATADAHIILFQGDDIYLSASVDSPITRIDVIAAAAVGTEETRLQALAGVM